MFSQDGFFSITAYDPVKGGDRVDAGDLIVVRGRVRADLERVATRIGDGEVLSTPRADYAYRMVVPRRSWASYLEAAVDEIDYVNFKDRVRGRLGSFRHDVLLSVWVTLRRLQEEPPSDPPGPRPAS